MNFILCYISASLSLSLSFSSGLGKSSLLFKAYQSQIKGNIQENSHLLKYWISFTKEYLSSPDAPFIRWLVGYNNIGIHYIISILPSINLPTWISIIFRLKDLF